MILLAILAVPPIAAAAAWLARERARMEAINVAAAVIEFALAMVLASQVLGQGAVTVFGGFFYADALSAVVILLTALASLLSVLYSVDYLRRDEHDGKLDDPPAKLRHYYTLTPLFIGAMMLVPVANNLGLMWVAIEATTLASVFLVTFYGRVTSLEAGWKYMIIGGVGLSMALFGTVVAFYSGKGVIGTESLSDLNWSVMVGHAAQFDKAAMRLAFILVLLGFGTKAGIAPMHTWKPDAYSQAPVPSTAILASAMMNCAMYGLMRHYALANRCLGEGFTAPLLILFGILSMGVAAPFQLVQRSYRRLLAYSSIEHGGIMLTALGLGATGSMGLMLHMVYHTVAKSMLFLCAGNVYQHYKSGFFAEIKEGVIHALPVTGTVFLAGTLAVVGMPPFGLFQSEFLILSAAFGKGYTLAGVLFIVFAACIFAGATLHVGKLVLGPPGPEKPAEHSPSRLGPILALALLLLGLGFWVPPPLYELLRGAARVVGGN